MVGALRFVVEKSFDFSLYGFFKLNHWLPCIRNEFTYVFDYYCFVFGYTATVPAMCGCGL